MNTQTDYKIVLAPAGNHTGWKVSRIALTESATIVVKQVVESARALTTIVTENDLQEFIKAETDIQDMLGQLEVSRKIVKAPFYEAGKTIDAAARETSALLESESKRLRAEMSRIYADRRRRELEEQRTFEELAAKERLKAIRANDEQEAAQHNRTSASAQAAAATAVTTVPGLSIRVGWDATLVDVVEVMRTNPHLLETTLRKSVIQWEIKRLEETGTVIKEDTIPGIKLTPKGSVNVRR